MTNYGIYILLFILAVVALGVSIGAFTKKCDKNKFETFGGTWACVPPCGKGTLKGCGLNTFYDKKSKTCKGCGTGQRGDGDSCKTCGAGYQVPQGSGADYWKCQKCPIGQYSTGGQATCTPCKTGTYYDHTGGEHESDCKTCPAGYKCPGGTSATKCTTNYWSALGQTTCTSVDDLDLPAGAYLGTEQRICLAGTYGDDCKTCPKDYACTSNVKTHCPQGNACDDVRAAGVGGTGEGLATCPLTWAQYFESLGHGCTNGGEGYATFSAE